jgi:hypothetical protein
VVLLQRGQPVLYVFPSFNKHRFKEGCSKTPIFVLDSLNLLVCSQDFALELITHVLPEDRDGDIR